MKVSDFVVSELIRNGVVHVFTLPGGFSMHLNDSFAHSAITTVYCLHESGAGLAACGYSRYTHGLSVCVVTSGPGSTNVTTAVASAWQDSLPVLFISGEAKVANIKMRHDYQLRQGGVQDVPITDMVDVVTKWAGMVYRPEFIKQQLEQAIEYALTPRRGPVWLAIPLDIQAGEC
jgi:acetolactate synthase-1/2/3 large subunit